MKHKVSKEREQEIVTDLKHRFWVSASSIRNRIGGNVYSVRDDLIELRRHSIVVSKRYGGATLWSLPETS